VAKKPGLGVIGVKRGLWRLLVSGVRLVGILPFLDRLGYPCGIPLCVLDLLLCLLVGGSPDVDQVEEGCRGIKGCRCLSRDRPVSGSLTRVGREVELTA